MVNSKLPSDYRVIDLETSIKNRGDGAVGTMKASPFHPDNKIVYSGSLSPGKMHEPLILNHTKLSAVSMNNLLLVGQNIKFDLLYLLHSKSLVNFNLYECGIWDTMLAEYLLTGQRSQFASLDSLAKKYGGTVKNSTIKEYWDNDVDTEDIPEEELIPYLEDDVLNTNIVFKAQWAKAVELGMLPLIKSQMRALKATTFMEYNGMHFDIDKAYEKGKEVYDYLVKLEKELVDIMLHRGIWEPNPASIDHVSLYFFGGKQKVEERVPLLDEEGNHITFKTGARAGQPRFKNVKKELNIVGSLISSTFMHPAKKKGFYKVDDEVLQNIMKFSTRERETAAKILNFRALNKDLKTYYVGFSKLYWPHDQKIHGTIHHTATATGRLSSRSPNLQNLTSADQ